MAILDLCEKYFNTRNIYELLQVEKTALPKDIKKAYYKLSLQVHPDRCVEAEKEEATEKFKILSKIYQVLSDKNQRDIYDESGVIEDEDDMSTNFTSWLDLWQKIFKPLTFEDIQNYEKSYVNSDLERYDIKKAYLSAKGCINTIMDEVPFLKMEDEPRLQKIVGEMIAANEVPEYEIFTNEPAQKRKRRHKKLQRLSKEAEKISKDMEKSGLEQRLAERQKYRHDNFNSLMDKLLDKYGNDDSEVVDFDALDKKTKKKKKATAQVNKKKNTQDKLRNVKAGKVTKKN